jgi:hypothetical protein
MEFDPCKHVNYVHLVGVVDKIDYRLDANNPHALINLKIQTEYKGRLHDPMYIEVVAWDRTANLMFDNNVKENDIIHVEGRVTIREKQDRIYSGVTANRIKLVVSIEGREPFAKKLEVV